MAGFGFVFGGSGLVRIYCQYSGSGHFHPGSNCTGKMKDLKLFIGGDKVTINLNGAVIGNSSF